MLLGASRKPASVQYVGMVGNAGNTASPTTFAGFGIGPAYNERWVVAIIQTLRDIGISVSAVTIGGVAATQVGSYGGQSGGNQLSSMWIAKVPAGTTANVVATHSAAATMACQCYVLQDLKDGGVPYNVSGNFSSAGVSSLACNLNYDTGGVAVMGAGWSNAVAATVAGGLVVETVDAGYASGAWRQYGAAFGPYGATGAGTGTITINMASAVTRPSMVAAFFK